MIQAFPLSYSSLHLCCESDGLSITKEGQHVDVQISHFFLNPSLISLVFPVVTYGCESWTIKKAEH